MIDFWKILGYNEFMKLKVNDVQLEDFDPLITVEVVEGNQAGYITKVNGSVFDHRIGDFHYAPIDNYKHFSQWLEAQELQDIPVGKMGFHWLNKLVKKYNHMKSHNTNSIDLTNVSWF